MDSSATSGEGAGGETGGNTRLRLQLELELSEPVRGRLREAGGSERSFTGWLELHAALESACRAARAASADADPTAVAPPPDS